MNQNKKDGQPGSQFDSGFGGTMFGGGNTQFGGGTNAGPTGAGPGATQGGFGGAPGGTNGGEFASGFGGTNAVSQIFREGGFSGEDRRKKFLIGGAVVAALAACAAVYFLFVQEKPPAADAPAAAAESADASADNAAEEEDGAATGDEEYADEEEGSAEGEGAAEAGAASAPASAGAGAASAGAPIVAGSSSYDYNEEAGGPVVSAPAGSVIEVSRRASFSDRYVTGTVGQGGTFRIPNPPPGKVYWRSQGSGSANQITVNPPVGLGIQFQAPATLSEGGNLSWTATGPSAYFRVEFATDPSFATNAHVISTNQMAAPVTGVSAGSYFVRIGGLNRAAGKWEFSQASKLEVQ